jgi:hypothetical protein
MAVLCVPSGPILKPSGGQKIVVKQAVKEFKFELLFFAMFASLQKVFEAS